MIALTFEAAGYRDAQGRFAKRSEGLVRQQREMVREQSRLMVATLREEAPKKTGVFAEGIAYRTSVTSEGARSAIYVRGEHAHLLNWIVGGTKPHEIPKGGSAAQMAKGYPLRFFWEKGPRGPDVYYFWSVQHPGTKPDDFTQRALDRRWPDMRAALQKVAVRATYSAGV